MGLSSFRETGEPRVSTRSSLFLFGVGLTWQRLAFRVELSPACPFLERFS